MMLEALKLRPAYNLKAPKRPVNLSLNEDLIAKAREVTNNLSEVVESLLADFVAKEKVRRDAHAKALKDAVDDWNAFGEKHGSFADEHSTL
jgi:antitoxin CcdA